MAGATDRYLKAAQEQVDDNHSWDNILEIKQTVMDRATALSNTIVHLLNKIWWLQGYSNPITVTTDGKSVSFSVQTYIQHLQGEANEMLSKQRPSKDITIWPALSDRLATVPPEAQQFDGLLEGSGPGAFPAIRQGLDQAIQTLGDGLQAQDSTKIKQGVDQGVETLNRLKIVTDKVLKPFFKEIPTSVYDDIQLPTDPKETLSVLRGVQDHFENFKIALDGDPATNAEGLKHILTRQLVDATKSLIRLDHIVGVEERILSEVFGGERAGLLQEMQETFDQLEAAQADPKQSQFETFSMKKGQVLGKLVRSGGGRITEPVNRDGKPLGFHSEDVYPKLTMKGEYVPGHKAGETVPIDKRADEVLNLYEEEKSLKDEILDHTQILRFQGVDFGGEEEIKIIRYPDEEEGAEYNILTEDSTGGFDDPVMRKAQEEIRDELAKAAATPPPPKNQPPSESQPPPQKEPTPQEKTVKINPRGEGTKINIISAILITALLEEVHSVFFDNSKSSNTNQVKQEGQKFIDKTTQAYSSPHGRLDLKDNQGNTIVPLAIGGDVQSTADIIRLGYRNALTHEGTMQDCGALPECAQKIGEQILNTLIFPE